MSAVTLLKDEIDSLGKRYKTNLINSLTGFKSVTLVGTYNTFGKTNLAIFSQVIHVGADPPLIGLLSRPNVVKRDTMENILQQQYFSINHLHSDFYQKAHHTAARWEISEFDACGLEPQKIGEFPAPFVQESKVKVGIKLKERIDIKSNGTHLLIGEILLMHIDGVKIEEDGYIDLESGGILTCSGLDGYHQTSRLARLSYAKTDHPPTELE